MTDRISSMTKALLTLCIFFICATLGAAMALFARNAAGLLAADLDACNTWKTGAEAARKLRCPCLVLLGANDIMTPTRNGGELAALIAGSRTVTIEDCGHMMQAEAPDAVLDALLGFFV